MKTIAEYIKKLSTMIKAKKGDSSVIIEYESHLREEFENFKRLQENKTEKNENLEEKFVQTLEIPEIIMESLIIDKKDDHERKGGLKSFIKKNFEKKELKEALLVYCGFITVFFILDFLDQAIFPAHFDYIRGLSDEADMFGFIQICDPIVYKSCFPLFSGATYFLARLYLSLVLLLIFTLYKAVTYSDSNFITFLVNLYHKNLTIKLILKKDLKNVPIRLLVYLILSIIDFVLLAYIGYFGEMFAYNNKLYPYDIPCLLFSMILLGASYVLNNKSLLHRKHLSNQYVS